jgi:hypothetical protein
LTVGGPLRGDCCVDAFTSAEIELADGAAVHRGDPGDSRETVTRAGVTDKTAGVTIQQHD